MVTVNPEDKFISLAIVVGPTGEEELLIGSFKTYQDAADAYVEWEVNHDNDSLRGMVRPIDIHPGTEVEKPAG